MEKKTLIAFRARESDKKFIEEEAIRLRRILGLNVSMSDVIRFALETYNDYLKEGKVDRDSFTMERIEQYEKMLKEKGLKTKGLQILKKK